MLVNQARTERAAKVALVVVTTAFLSLGSPARGADRPQTADVLQALHLSDQKEIAAGKIAERSGKSSQAREYGKMLQRDHSDAEKKVTELAQEENISLTDGSTGTDLSDLTSDPMFDTKFAVTMLGNHKKDIADVTDARDNTSDSKLKKLLSDLLPMLQKHRETAQKIIDTEAH